MVTPGPGMSSRIIGSYFHETNLLCSIGIAGWNDHLFDQLIIKSSFTKAGLQDLLQLFLLIHCQGRWEVDLVPDDEISPLAGLLGDWHAEAGVSLFAVGVGRAALFEVQLSTINGCHLPPPSCQCLLKIESHDVDNIVVFALEQRVFFL